MFLAILTYTQALDAIDALLPAHVAYLDAQYAAGRFVMSGRRVPRTGGVIVLDAPDLATAQAWLQDDPFYQAEVARYELFEFTPSKVRPGLEALLAPPPAP